MKSIFILFLSFFSLCLIISLLTRKFRNPWKLFMVFGKKGSGKSTFLVKQIICYLHKGFDVYCNMPELYIDGVKLINVDDLGEFIPKANSLLVLDEVGMVWDNRQFKNFKPSVRDFFKLQRHYHVVCYLASQTFDIDKKLRDLTDGMYLCVSFLNVFSVGKRITRKIVLTESTSEAESRISENLRFTPFWNWSFTFIPRWTRYFNSFEVPALPELPFTEVSGHVISRCRAKRRHRSALQQLRDLKRSQASNDEGQG